MARASRFDVAVVGASVAGCATARLFAQAGLRVALVERQPDPLAYKVACTHAILPSATAVIERLGLASRLSARGALRTQAELWTPYGGWLRFPDDAPDGWGVTRRTLDPLLRELAAGTPGVELLSGRRATGVVDRDGRPAGVEVTGADGRRLVVPARLLVGADGRGSSVARLARVPGRVRPHNRFFYFAYWRGLRPRSTANRLWLLDPDAAALFPNEDDLSVLVVSPARSRLPEFRAGAEGAYRRMARSLPCAPHLDRAERASKLLGALDVPNVMRPAAGAGVAFVGDAALATDPLFGVGLSFALQSAAWLVDETAGAVVRDDRALDHALRRYRRTFAWRLGPHQVQIADYATARRTRPLERATFRAATLDPSVALAFGQVIARMHSPLRLVDPRFAARVLVRGRRTRRLESGRAATTGGTRPVADMRVRR
jgi:2-polyprenyl-6-methoxyphenol hydroxylase-like FAD-dependent oxidoreductase